VRPIPAVAVALLALPLLILGACAQPPADDARRDAQPERYARDRDLCRAQVDEYMRTRRNIDDSRRDVFRGDDDRFGRGDLPRQMAAYGDTRTSDRMLADCMASRGWQQPQKQWWQKL